MRIRVSHLALCVAIALGSVPVLAQNTTSAVAGKVITADGKAASGATVTITHVESNSTTSVVADSEGRYHARALRAGGPYTITFTKDGVTEKREGVFLTLAETTALDVTMRPREVITITAQGLSSTDKFSPNSMGTTTQLGRQEVESLPSIQRNLQDLARIDPRVSQTDKERGEMTVMGQNSRYNKITIDSMNISDTFGLEANTMATLKQPVSIDAIQSVQVNVSNYDVTQTGYVGGNINAVTKSGTNDYHGTVTYAWRDEQVSGKRYNRGTDTYSDPLPFEEKLLGFTFGGPIIKDKLFFFLGYEELNSTRNPPDFGPVGSSSGGIVGISQAAIAGVTALAQSQYKIDLGTLGSGGKDLTVKDYLAKIDWNINSQHRANLRYTKTEQTEPMFNLFTATALSTTTNWFDQEKVIETLVGQWFADWSRDFSTELKVSRRDYHSEPVNPTTLPQMQFSYSGALPIGSPTGVNTGTRTLFTGTERSRHFNILDTVTDDLYFGATWVKGDHEIKGLFDYSDNKIFNAFLQDTKGNYTFSCVNSSATYTYSFGAINCGSATAAQVEAAVLENFQRGRPSTYSVQVPLNSGGTLFDGVAQFHVKNLGYALQDTWSVNPNLTVQFGVRVDTPKMPDSPLYNAAAAQPTVPGSVSGTTVTRNSGGFGRDNRNTIDGETLVQPRVGFNYTFDTSRPMQVRGGVGLFQGAAATVWLSNVYSNTGVATRIVGCGGAFAACPSAGGIFSPDSSNQITNFPGAAPAANVDFLESGLGQPAAWKGNLAFEHKLPWGDMTFSAEYVASRNKVALYYQHLNLGGPTRTGSDGRPLFWTPTAYLPQCWNSTGSRITRERSAASTTGTARFPTRPTTTYLMAAKSDKGEGKMATVQLAGRAFKELNWSLAYTYNGRDRGQRAHVFRLQLELAGARELRPERAEESNSAYLVKDRINATLVWEKAFFGKYKTRIGAFYEGRTGKPYAWTFSNDMNGTTSSATTSCTSRARSARAT
jgi:hypothetical protein